MFFSVQKHVVSSLEAKLARIGTAAEIMVPREWALWVLPKEMCRWWWNQSPKLPRHGSLAPEIQVLMLDPVKPVDLGEIWWSLVKLLFFHVPATATCPRGTWKVCEGLGLSVLVFVVLGYKAWWAVHPILQVGHDSCPYCPLPISEGVQLDKVLDSLQSSTVCSTDFP